jgi:hypothetical protein
VRVKRYDRLNLFTDHSLQNVPDDILALVDKFLVQNGLVNSKWHDDPKSIFEASRYFILPRRCGTNTTIHGPFVKHRNKPKKLEWPDHRFISKKPARPYWAEQAMNRYGRYGYVASVPLTTSPKPPRILDAAP